jgi:hypothetical protein
LILYITNTKWEEFSLFSRSDTVSLKTSD